MRIVKVVIVDKNQVYSKALADYLLSEYGQAFDISCFSGIKPLAEHLNINQEVDIMLIDQDLYNDSLKGYSIKNILILTDNGFESEIEGLPALYKHQLGDQIAKQILRNYDESVGSRFNVHSQQGESKLIAAYSPAGGSGKSTIAYNIARQYTIKGEKALLISMESYASNYFSKVDSSNRGLSYLTYLIKSNANNLQVKFDSIKEVDVNTNVHYIPRSSNSLEYKDMDPEDTVALLEFLKKHSGYDAIVLDMDSSMNEKLLCILKYCDVILNIKASDLVSRDKYQNFTQQLDILSNQLGINLAEKMICVNNKAAGQLSDKQESGIDIPYMNDNFLAENGYYPELIYFKQLYDAIENFFAGKRVSA